MEKLTAIDASFLYSETNNCNSNVASVNLLKLPEGTSATEWLDSFKDYMTARLHTLPYLTRKLAFTPASLDHPVWVLDTDFDINQHIIEVQVDAPGDMPALERAVAAVHEAKLPLDRPLWTMYILTGLEDGRIALCNQVHHATIDGASGNMAVQVLMDETPEHPEVEPGAPVTEKAPAQLALSLLEDAMFNFTRFQLGAAQRMMGSLETSRRLLQRSMDPAKDFGVMGRTAPPTPFNTEISARRAWSTGELSLVEMKAMSKKIGVTLNDLMLAICAGGMKQYLDRKGLLPDESLIAGCPVSLRKPGDATQGTQVTMMNVDLATNVEDPMERLKVIRESALTAKELVEDLAGVFESNAALPGMPAMMSSSLQAVESLGMARFFRGPINVVISNVPGPRNTLYLNGAEMQSHYPVSIPTHTMGLNITVQSYRDTMFLGLTACARAVPDVDVLRDDMIAAFEELKAVLLPVNVHELKPRSPVAAEKTDQVEEVQQNQVA